MATLATSETGNDYSITITDTSVDAASSTPSMAKPLSCHQPPANITTLTGAAA